MAKLTAYILMVLGIIIIASPFLIKSTIDKLPFKSFWIIIAGLILLLVGFVFLKPGKVTQASEEVPIYSGKKIVGYRKEK